MKRSIFSLGRRLYFRLYAVQALAIVVGSLIITLMWPSGRRERAAFTYFSEWALQRIDDPPGLQRDLDELAKRLGVRISVFGNGGRVLAREGPPWAPLAAPALARLEAGQVEPLPGQGIAVGRSDEQGRLLAYTMLAVVPEPTTRTERYFRIFGVMLLVFVIGNGPLVRLILSPLERLARTAKAFGAGDLKARANLDRQDEIGDLGRAFDEMATRVEAFRRTEKELLANVSHELRTPLARIRVVLELAAEKFPEAAQRYTTEIAADLTELEQLIDDIIRTARFDLTNARVGDPYPPLNLGQVSIGAFVESLGRRFAKAYPERTVVFDVDYELAIAADPMMLKRALGNVLENAHKYSAPSGGIAIRVERDSADPDRVLIAICDNGPGLGAADAALVFTPFFRGQREHKSDAAGIGLGLTLAQRIVEAHGGSIRLRSAPSEGTTVTVTLPLQSED